MVLETVTVAQADTYFTSTPRAAAWGAVTEKEVQLTEAERWVRTLTIDEEADCGSGLEYAWISAVSEVALALHESPNAIITGTVQGGPVVQTNTLGDLSQTFFAQDQWKGRYGRKSNPLLIAFPWVGTILGCWLNEGSGLVLDRVRS